MNTKRRGSIICIGGREDKEQEKVILTEVARRAKPGKLVLTAVASSEPQELYEIYEKTFRDLGVKNLARLGVRDRLDASSPKALDVLAKATAVFFTGGDQLRITSQLGGTPALARIKEIYAHGGLIAGTSAGASVVCSTMLTAGTGQESHKMGDLLVAPGLGLVDWAIIDQHFAERGRMGRLLGAIAENPFSLGIGIDEDTAIVIDGHDQFHVLGDGAVYVVDGSGITYSNIAEATPQKTVSMYDVKIHVLSEGDVFDIEKRAPHLTGQPVKKAVGHR